MKGTDTGKDKVKKICDVLRRETLEPAKQEAEQIIHQAELQAAELIKAAKQEAEKLKTEATKEIEKERLVFTSALQQGGKQALESLRNEIEKKLFNPALAQIITPPLSEPKVILELIQAVISSVEKEGLDADLDISIPASISAKEISDAVIRQVGKNLRNHSVSLDNIEGGIEVKLTGENITIDMTDKALQDWVSKYVRQDFRKILFGVK